MKRTILIAVLCCLSAAFASAKDDSETVRADRFYFSLGADTQINLNLRFIDVGGQFEMGWWFTPYTAVAINAGANRIIARNSSGADEIFSGQVMDYQARLMGLLDLTNIFLGEELGARTNFHMAGYLGLGKIVNEVPQAGTKYYWLPSVGVDLSDRISRHTSLYVRLGANLYHPLHNLTVYPEASLGLRVSPGKGRTYAKDPAKVYKDNIAELEKELEKARNEVRVQTDTIVVTETKEVPVEKIIRDTVTVTYNQVDTLTIYDVVEADTSVSKAPVVVRAVSAAAPADTVYIETEPVVLVETLVQTDTVYVPADTEIRFLTDTVFVASEPEVVVMKETVVQTDTVILQSDPEIMIHTVYVNNDPIVLRDTVFVATDPEVQIQTVYRDREPVIVKDTVYVKSEPEIQFRTIYREKKVVQVDTVVVASDPEIIIQKDTVLIEKDPIVETVVKVDTVLIEKDPIVETVVKVDTVLVEKDPIVETVVKIDTVFVDKEPEVILETITQTDTVVVEKEVPTAIEPESILVEIHFPENAAWVNYGGRKQLDKLAAEIKADGTKKYIIIAPVSPDSEDAVTAYNLGVRRVSQARLHLIRENGVDSRLLEEKVIVSALGNPVEDGNSFIIVAREDDPRISVYLSE